MNARTAVFSLLSIKSYPLKRLVKRLPYAPPTVYEAVSQLVAEGLVRRAGGLVSVADGYRAKKLADIHVSALSFGVDPEFLFKKSTVSIWKAFDKAVSFVDVRDSTGYSLVTVKNVMKYLEDKGLIRYIKRKPVSAVRVDDHPLNELLLKYFKTDKDEYGVHYPGTTPFIEKMRTPEDVERLLFKQIDQSLAVKDTGFLVKGDGERITIVESVDEEPTLEDLFLRKLWTSEGVEDICVKILSQGKLDHERLLMRAMEKKMVNVVGCYLDIVNDIGGFLSDKVIEMYQMNLDGKKRVFLPEEKQYGKDGWEGSYEKKWNVELFLDLDAIRHGVRSA